MLNHAYSRPVVLTMWLGTVALLSACGGGMGSSSDPTMSSTPLSASSTSTATSLALATAMPTSSVQKFDAATPAGTPIPAQSSSPTQNATPTQTSTPAPATAPAPAPAPAGWTFCANENATCSFTGSMQVRYGAGGTYVVRTYAGGVSCSNAVFGDPVYGVVKHCEIGSAASTPGTTTTTTTATITPTNAMAPTQTPAPLTPAPAVGTMALAWIAPTAKADGTPLTNLAGFHILVGTASGAYSQTITVASAYTLNYTISGLPASTYYAVVKAFDTSNNESAPSAEVSKAIR